jgi:hypothetical protein
MEQNQTERLHRLVKQVLDSGAASSVEAAEALFRTYRLAFTIDEAEARTAAGQAALLTGVALARRVFLGGVTVAGGLDARLLVPLPLGCNTLGTAVTTLGGVPAASVDGSIPKVSVGGASLEAPEAFHLRMVYQGWRGGVVPADDDEGATEADCMPLAAMLAAALSVSEAFFHVQGDTPAAGQRRIGLSLWRPDPAVDWLCGDDGAPEIELLPSRLWLIGLGHLGQAYLWALSLLPYAQRGELELMLQDVDVVTTSTESTSILTDASMVGIKKTRCMATWAERRGFGTTILERLFDGGFKRQEIEPAVALCGLDNALGRRALDEVGFSFIVEAGLGHGYRDFRTMRLHTLPGRRSSADIWQASAPVEDLSARAAYRKLLADGVLDQCGITLLAGKAVGAPFVGSVAATLAVSEILRLLHGGVVSELIDLDLQSVEHRAVVPQQRDFSHLNPGYRLIALRPPTCSTFIESASSEGARSY